MRTLRSWLLMAVACPLFLGATIPATQSKESMLSELDFLRHVFQVRYAPAEWKKQHSQWDLDEEIEIAKAAVNECSPLTLKDYQRIIQRFCNRTGDYHVGVQFFSTEAAYLPFEVTGAEGSYFICAIDREKLSQRSFGFEVGDELVLFDGKPTVDVIKSLAASDLANSGTPTDYALAEILLTSRSAGQGHVVPRGPVSIAVKSAKTGQVSSYQIIWDHFPEKIKNLAPMAAKLSPSIESLAAQGRLLEHPFFTKRKMVTPFWNPKVVKAPMANCHPNELGCRESFVPRLGKVVWETDEENPFDAYIFQHPDSHRHIGYVRIPHYCAAEEEVEHFRAIIAQMQQQTDALVIDQVNNPGGSAFYLYALASMLSDQPMWTPRHRMSLTQQDISVAIRALPCFEDIKSDADAKEMLGETYEGYPVNYQFSQFMRQFFRFIIDEWDAGHCLTSPYYLEGVDHINPDPVRYTKPILMLINRLDFSGGDFLAAILQDNKRVTLFGERTAGAGGYVEGFSHPNAFGICYLHYTASIAERTQGCPIETLGVTPDIPYSLTRKDIENGYQGYARGVLDAVDGLLRQKG